MAEADQEVLTLEQDSVDDVFKRIVSVLGERPGVSEGLEGSEDRVLLETHVDGVRYQLVRHAPPPVHAKPRKIKPNLTPREQEIARMIGEGYPNKVIADVLEISCWTVSTYLRRMFAKFNVTSRAALIAQLAQAGALPQHSP
jgi:DNA-binding CsgD family transcriptional regulator